VYLLPPKQIIENKNIFTDIYDIVVVAIMNKGQRDYARVDDVDFDFSWLIAKMKKNLAKGG